VAREFWHNPALIIGLALEPDVRTTFEVTHCGQMESVELASFADWQQLPADPCCFAYFCKNRQSQAPMASATFVRSFNVSERVLDQHQAIQEIRPERDWDLPDKTIQAVEYTKMPPVRGFVGAKPPRYSVVVCGLIAVQDRNDAGGVQWVAAARGFVDKKEPVRVGDGGDLADIMVVDVYDDTIKVREEHWGDESIDFRAECIGSFERFSGRALTLLHSGVGEARECALVSSSIARKERKRLPCPGKRRYHVIDLHVSNRTVSLAPSADPGPIQWVGKAFHWVRGHTRVCASGKQTWVRPHHRGNRAFGVVEKDYEVVL